MTRASGVESKVKSSDVGRRSSEPTADVFVSSFRGFVLPKLEIEMVGV